MRIKNYYPHLLVFVILLTFAIASVCSYIRWEHNNLEKLGILYKENCTENVLPEAEENCNFIRSQVGHKYSFFAMQLEIFSAYYMPDGIVVLLLLILPAGYYITKYLKNRIIVSENNRLQYKDAIKKVFKNAYAVAFIMPLVMGVLFLISVLYTKSFAVLDFEWGSVMWSESTVSNPLVFIVSYLFNYLLISIVYVNCVLIVARKCHNYILTTVLSFLTILGVELFLEVVVNGIICFHLLHTGVGTIFSILNPMAFNDSYGILPLLIFSLIMCLTSFILVYFSYKNKEKLVIDCEKNS